MSQDALMPSEQSLRSKQTLKETYFPHARDDLARLMINMSTEAYPCTPVQEQLILPQCLFFLYTTASTSMFHIL